MIAIKFYRDEWMSEIFSRNFDQVVFFRNATIYLNSDPKSPVEDSVTLTKQCDQTIIMLFEFRHFDSTELLLRSSGTLLFYEYELNPIPMTRNRKF